MCYETVFSVARHLPFSFVLTLSVILISPVKVTKTVPLSNSNYVNNLRLVHSDVDLDTEDSKSPIEE